jgi:hypothetical protein
LYVTSYTIPRGCRGGCYCKENNFYVQPIPAPNPITSARVLGNYNLALIAIPMKSTFTKVLQSQSCVREKSKLGVLWSNLYDDEDLSVVEKSRLIVIKD